MKRELFFLRGQRGTFLVFLCLFLFLTPLLSHAQLDALTGKFQTLASAIRTILHYVVPVLFILGGLRVFYQYKSGNPDAKNSLISLIIGGAVYGALDLIAGFLGVQ